MKKSRLDSWYCFFGFHSELKTRCKSSCRVYSKLFTNFLESFSGRGKLTKGWSQAFEVNFVESGNPCPYIPRKTFFSFLWWKEKGRDFCGLKKWKFDDVSLQQKSFFFFFQNENMIYQLFLFGWFHFSVQICSNISDHV